MNNRLKLELAKEYYKLAPLASITLCALLGVTVYFYWGKTPSHLLLMWAGVNFIAASSFVVASRLFYQYATQSNAWKWLRAYAFLLLFQDAPWGLIGPLSFMADDPLYRILTLFMLGGMTTGAIITRGIIFKIYLISLFSLLLPIIITLALQGTIITDAMLSLTLVYLVFMLAVAKKHSASVVRNMHLWLSNEKLVRKLQISHAEVEEVNRDLTEEVERRRKIERELVEAKERSERANEAKNQFLATVSHELRTPLNGIVGFSDLLRDEELQEKPKRYIYQINKASKALQHIVNDILDIAAIEAGHIILYNEPFSLRAEMEDLLGIMMPMAEQKNLSLRFQIGQEVKDELCGDVHRLKQIVGNLLSNALKYTETGCVGLSINYLGTRKGMELLRFDIEDTGVGINEEAMNFIFKNFTRLENFETRKSEGAGLGLAIVKSLVNKMNGKLKVQSEVGKGSCFSCELPFEEGRDADEKTQPVLVRELSLKHWQTSNVLVVDDNEINRMVLTALLAKIGIPFAEAKNGLEALERIRSGEFDLVLLDIQMPDISGIDVAARLREEGGRIPALIAVTAHAFPEHRQAILDAGFSDLLIKPIMMDDLVKKLSHVCH